MLKWILGGCATLLVIACVAVWIGYRRLKTYAAEGPASTVMIMASPHRVFSSVADADSLADWRADGARMTTSHHGLLAVGDTVIVRGNAQSTNRRPSRLNWVVSAVTADKLIAFDVVDSTGLAMMTRRDSLVSVGDSTEVVSTFTAPIMDSVRSRNPRMGAVGQSVAGLASTAMIAAMRMASEIELKKLKSLIEGHPTTPPVSK